MTTRKTTHTPGPWNVTHLSDVTESKQFNIIHSDRELKSIICKLYDVTLCPEHGEIEANARLICAAPELLEALKELVLMYGRDSDSREEYIDAVRAIAKAEGK